MILRFDCRPRQKLVRGKRVRHTEKRMASVEISIDSTDTPISSPHFFLDTPHSRQTSQLSSRNTNKQQYRHQQQRNAISVHRKRYHVACEYHQHGTCTPHTHTYTNNKLQQNVSFSFNSTHHTHTRHVRLFHFRSFFIYDSLS